MGVHNLKATIFMIKLSIFEGVSSIVHKSAGSSREHREVRVWQSQVSLRKGRLSIFRSGSFGLRHSVGRCRLVRHPCSDNEGKHWERRHGTSTPCRQLVAVLLRPCVSPGV
jgi:hypothetical protein